MMNRVKWVLVMALASLSGACAFGSRTVSMSPAVGVPSASGTVKASPSEAGNTRLEIELRHMAQPQRVSLGATTFVVWALGLGQTTPQNIGALRVDDELRGTLSTLTPYSTFELFITAEADGDARAPTGEQVMRASISAG